MSSAGRVTAVLKRYFLSGVLVVVPLILTYFVLEFLFEAVDGVLKPLLSRVLGYYVTGLGVFVTLLLILLTGFFTRSLIGWRIYSLGDRILHRMPLIRPIYGAAKQLLEAVARPSAKSFREVALIEYPRRGTWALCFVTNRLDLQRAEGESERFVTVFIPSSPTPVSGWVVLVRPEEILPMEMTVEEAVKFVVSGGVASPRLVKQRLVASTS
jgi:uncharacterized membrane protein